MLFPRIKSKENAQVCLFCGDSENIQKHHVCWSNMSNENEKRHTPRSWNASLTVPMCITCRGIYLKSSNKEKFISKFTDEEKQESIRKKFDSAQLVIEDAIKMSYLIPLVNHHFCGKSYSYVKTMYPSLEDLLIKIKETPIVPSQFWGNTTIWGPKTKNYLDRRETELLNQFSPKSNSRNYEYIRKQVTKHVSYVSNRGWRSSRESIINVISSRNKKLFKEGKIKKSEIDYALCRMVANKELTMEPEYLCVLVKPIVYAKGVKEPTREDRWVMYYRFKLNR